MFSLIILKYEMLLGGDPRKTQNQAHRFNRLRIVLGLVLSDHRLVAHRHVLLPDLGPPKQYCEVLPY